MTYGFANLLSLKPVDLSSSVIMACIDSLVGLGRDLILD